MLTVLVMRLIDTIYWQNWFSFKDVSGSASIKRFSVGCLLTAVMWSALPILIFEQMNLLEFTLVVVVINAMAAGSQSILSASLLLGMSYTLILLVPISVLGVLSPEEHRQILGSVGLFFSAGLCFTSLKTAQFTAKSINVKNINTCLANQVELEKEQLNKVNNELMASYDKLNAINNNLEDEVGKLTEKIYQLSYLDPLTNLMNRKAFIKQLAKLTARSAKNEKALALLFIDLDGFKKINDSMGHQVGDNVLIEVANRIKAFADDNKSGRWGGVEFLVALPYSDSKTAIAIANAIITSLSQAIRVNVNEVHLSATIGIAISPQHSTTATELIQLADLAMCEQKIIAPRKARLFSAELQQKVVESQAMLDGLQHCIVRRQLFLCYQPILCAKNNTSWAFEALLRWDFNGQLIGPDLFIPLAEKSGLIKEIGAWVLNRACMDASQWQHAENAAVSVNVSVIQLMDDSFIRTLDNALRSSGLAPHRLHLEITESIFVDNHIKIRQQLAAIQQRNVHLSMDDFGTGYSSLSQLQTLSVNYVKIDKSFVDNIDHNGEAIIRATLFIARELDCLTVAEGVESKEQAMALTAMGVDFLQGYYFAEPMRNEALINWQNPIIDVPQI
ncbi:MAG: diguanylate cyclase (GGDEF)-like protein [Paraglaciecola sp.]|jgi:diguanylate cyclase (GGDEF)-like protein